MDDKKVMTIVVIVRIVILGLTSVGACLYAIPLCCIRRFHTPLQLLTLNVCIAAFICSSFWVISHTMDEYYPSIFWTPQSCLPIRYGQNMVNCQVLYALCLVSLNRLFTIVYQNKALFRTKKWAAICVGCQWIFATVIPLPTMASDFNDCLKIGLELNYRIYTLIIVVVIPAISLIITNSIIFSYVHRSTRSVLLMNEGRPQAITLRRRNVRLLKHMIFMFVVFFCGWTPIYLIKIINRISSAFSPITLQVFRTVPAVSLFIDVTDLFLYNYELRRYFTHHRQRHRSKFSSTLRPLM